MVSGKVKAVMGFQKTPPSSKPETPKHFSSSASSQKSLPLPPPPTKTVFSRSFGVYFPRSTQVQPRPPDAIDLVRLVEELQEKESRLKTELLEQKLLKETVKIVPFLEKEITSKDAEIERSAWRIGSLEAENEMLRREVESLKDRIVREGVENEKKVKEMEDEIAELKRGIESKVFCPETREIAEIDDCASSPQRFQGLIDASARSNLVRSSTKGAKSNGVDSNPEKEKLEITDLNGKDVEAEVMQQSCCSREISESKPKPPRVPKPPPRPSFSSSSTADTLGIAKSRASLESASLTEMPLIPPPFPVVSGAKAPIPPPPPPPLPPARVKNAGAAKVRRVPEVVEFYRSLMRRDSKRESGAGVPDLPPAANARDMIGEIENRSAHLLAAYVRPQSSTYTYTVEMDGYTREMIVTVHSATFYRRWPRNRHGRYRS